MNFYNRCSTPSYLSSTYVVAPQLFFSLFEYHNVHFLAYVDRVPVSDSLFIVITMRLLLLFLEYQYPKKANPKRVTASTHSSVSSSNSRRYHTDSKEFATLSEWRLVKYINKYRIGRWRGHTLGTRILHLHSLERVYACSHTYRICFVAFTYWHMVTSWLINFLMAFQLPSIKPPTIDVEIQSIC